MQVKFSLRAVHAKKKKRDNTPLLTEVQKTALTSQAQFRPQPDFVDRALELSKPSSPGSDSIPYSADQKSTSDKSKLQLYTNSLLML